MSRAVRISVIVLAAIGASVIAIVIIGSIGLDPVAAILAFSAWSAGMKLGQIVTERNLRGEHWQGCGFGVLMLVCFGLFIYFCVAMFRTH